MDAVERQSLFAELERAASTAPSPDVTANDVEDVPGLLRWRDILLFALAGISVFYFGATLLWRVERWLRSNLSSGEPDPGFELFGLRIKWSILVFPALTLVLWIVWAGLVRRGMSRFPVRRPTVKRLAAVMVSTGPPRSLWNRRGDHEVVLEDRSGSQTVFHAREEALPDVSSGTPGVAFVLHHRLLAFQPLGA